LPIAPSWLRKNPRQWFDSLVPVFAYVTQPWPRIAMPKPPWSPELIDGLIRCLACLIECADLSDAESDQLMAIVGPKLVENSGLGHAKFAAVLSASCAAMRREAGLAAQPARH
jgi:hypothetical protein